MSLCLLQDDVTGLLTCLFVLHHLTYPRLPALLILISVLTFGQAYRIQIRDRCMSIILRSRFLIKESTILWAEIHSFFLSSPSADTHRHRSRCHWESRLSRVSLFTNMSFWSLIIFSARPFFSFSISQEDERSVERIGGSMRSATKPKNRLVYSVCSPSPPLVFSSWLVASVELGLSQLKFLTYWF